MSTNIKFGLAGLLIVAIVITFAYILINEPEDFAPLQAESTGSAGAINKTKASEENI
jgi:hypothetical protein